jgi:hypothetical protein
VHDLILLYAHSHLLVQVSIILLQWSVLIALLFQLDIVLLGGLSIGQLG